MTNTRLVNVNITFKNTDSTEGIKQYVTDKVTHSLKKFIHHDTEAHVVLRVEKNRHIAEITFNTDGANFHCSEESEDLYASIDVLMHSVNSQLRRHKDKITKHH